VGGYMCDLFNQLATRIVEARDITVEAAKRALATVMRQADAEADTAEEEAAE
jgi:hypothetical protein